MTNQITHKETTFHVGDTVKVYQTIKEGENPVFRYSRG